MSPGDDDFDFALEEWTENRKRRFDHLKEINVPSQAELPKIELSLAQKRSIVGYVLGSVSKGLFEDVPEFWEGVEDIEGMYSTYRQATDEFVCGLRNRLLEELK